ncbi:MAG: transglutaminase-like putative cysteine protease [Marivirga sp.]|jgi:transglutaminase-like putative cysteine protease
MSLAQYLKSSYFFDLDSPQVQSLIKDFKESDLSEKDKAIGLYLKVRDGWRYNPHTISFKPKALVASTIYRKKDGHCIDKSVLLIAGLRALKIPARLHLAKVKNHIAAEKLREKFGSNELTPHEMVDIFLNDKWLKVSPAFNKTHCDRCLVDPLDFNGLEDSSFQEYNKANQQFMEYTADYGAFDDVPVSFIFENMKAHYPKIFADIRDQAFKL